MIAKPPYHDLPNEYDDEEEDALGHAFSLSYLGDDLPDYMNSEQELYDLPSALDPLEQLINEEAAEWEESEDGDKDE